MSDRGAFPERLGRVRVGYWLAAALLAAALAGCEHGQLSFNRDTGQFSVPIGAGSRETR